MFFEWTNYDAVDYTNWARREPNNMGNGEDCVNIYYYVSYVTLNLHLVSVTSRVVVVVVVVVEWRVERQCMQLTDVRSVRVRTTQTVATTDRRTGSGSWMRRGMTSRSHPSIRIYV